MRRRNPLKDHGTSQGGEKGPGKEGRGTSERFTTFFRVFIAGFSLSASDGQLALLKKGEL
ncbi:MAG: hypothetical protein D6679_12455 [Candidatus Hydrogenedentota bacterium]|nr:MAG: hypothetical protein D6679_12455 [Candidatus Hydrogenedentota bacterium]